MAEPGTVAGQGMAGSVLIVDDSLTVRMDLLGAFEAGGLHAIASATAAEARKALSHHVVDVLVLDVLLPDADGVEFLQELRATPRYRQLAVLLLSSEAAVKDRVRGMRTGADEYIGKPYDVSYVVAKARQLLRDRVPSEGAATTVLIIDDSLTVRSRVQEALEGAGYQVFAADTGELGLSMAADIRPDAVIVDGALPGVDGATVIRRIRLDAALRHTPCLLLTASGDRSGELQALDAGADAYVRKEDDIAVVLAKLAVVLRQGRPATPGQDIKSLHGPMRILAVDDSVSYLETIGGRLREEGYEVILARSGEEALQLLAAQTVDCILLDVVMPGLDGHQTCRRIKAVPAVRDIPLIMMAALDDVGAMFTCLAEGADDYIPKSDRFDILKARVRAQIRRKHFADENRYVQEQLLAKELEATEARAARQLAETRAAIVDERQTISRERELMQATAQARAAAMRAAEEARDAAVAQSELKSQFMATMSHEIRTPMNGVIGLAFLLLGTDLDPGQRRYAAGIHTAGNALLAVINDILDFSKIEAGKLLLDTDDFDVSAVLAEVATLVGPTVKGNVTVLTHRDADLPATLRGDGARLRQILLNLAANAVKFTAEGSVTMRAENAGMPVGSGKVCVRFEVSDTGIGIAAADVQRLFQPFTQADASTTSSYGGTGLGLAICRQLTEAMGGTIGVDSEPGEGSTFWCLIPFDAARDSDPPPVRDVAGLRVLVLDAGPSQAMLQENLRRWNMTTTAEDTVADAVHTLRQDADRGFPFDVAIVDGDLAGVDPADLARRIAADPHIPAVYIIVLNPRGTAAAIGITTDGISAYLAKPIHQSELFECLTTASTRLTKPHRAR